MKGNKELYLMEITIGESQHSESPWWQKDAYHKAWWALQGCAPDLLSLVSLYSWSQFQE